MGMVLSRIGRYNVPMATELTFVFSSAIRMSPRFLGPSSVFVTCLVEVAYTGPIPT